MSRYLILIVFLTGCGVPITNDQVIIEVNKCKAAGMGYILHRTAIANGITGVSCDYSYKGQS